MNARGWRWPLLLSGIVLLSPAFPLLSPVRDAATFEWANGFHLHFPFWHLVFTPFCGLADVLTVLSAHQLYIAVGYVFLACGALGRRRGALVFAFFLAFIAWGVLIPRPMGRLTADNPNLLLIDFHSHTQYSHDGRKSFTPEANRQWHERQGYNASFITDHNLIDAAEIAKKASSEDWQASHYRSLQGEEVSLQKTHLVILGNTARIDNRPYDGDFAHIPAFVSAMHKAGIPVIASLPEYWLYHWGEGVQDFVRWGMDGFEIVNSAPKAMDFPIAYRLHIIDLCRSQNLFMTGISDNHGYGYATAVWNAVQLPGWHAMNPDQLEKAVVQTLKSRRFSAVQVLERVKFFPETWVGLALSPIGALWVYWRSLQAWQGLSWVLWIWGLYFLYPARH